MEAGHVTLPSPSTLGRRGCVRTQRRREPHSPLGRTPLAQGWREVRPLNEDCLGGRRASHPARSRNGGLAGASLGGFEHVLGPDKCWSKGQIKGPLVTEALRSVLGKVCRPPMMVTSLHASPRPGVLWGHMSSPRPGVLWGRTSSPRPRILWGHIMPSPRPGSSGGTRPLPVLGSSGGTRPLPAPGSFGGTRPLSTWDPLGAHALSPSWGPL
ncbi:hypothetical protein MC885_010069, partial [Smutsia gigantea]